MTKHARTFSLVIPCYNDEALLTRCLESIKRQTVAPDEVVIVDNNCTDSSAEIARSYGMTVVEEPRQGINYATLCGIEKSTSDIIIRTDADAVLPDDYFEHLHRIWDQIDASDDPEHIVGTTSAGRFEIPGWRGDFLSWLYLHAYWVPCGAMLGHPPFYGTNCSFRRSWWEEVKDTIDFSKTYAHEDFHLSFAVRPWETIWQDATLCVDMDSRALALTSQMPRRFNRGFYTFWVNWKKERPWTRLERRRLAREGRLPRPL